MLDQNTKLLLLKYLSNARATRRHSAAGAALTCKRVIQSRPLQVQSDSQRAVKQTNSSMHSRRRSPGRVPYSQRPWKQATRADRHVSPLSLAWSEQSLRTDVWTYHV